MSIPAMSDAIGLRKAARDSLDSTPETDDYRLWLTHPQTVLFKQRLERVREQLLEQAENYSNADLARVYLHQSHIIRNVINNVLKVS